MIRSFKHKGLARFFIEGKKKGIQPEHEQRLRSILARLQASRYPQDMDLPGLRLHPLRGDKQGWHAVVVSGNWRVVFRFVLQDACDVDYLDYH